MTENQIGRGKVIKFTLDFHHQQVCNREMTAALSSWRLVLHRLGLIGCDPGRYHGLGSGNISSRRTEEPGHFLISGTQTGTCPWLAPEQYALVTRCDPGRNVIGATGGVRPSSEALTHGQLYQQDPRIMAVVHAHSPEIYRHWASLGLLRTADDAHYGTVAMAMAVKELFAAGLYERGLFVMGGHEDGVVSFGTTLEEACQRLVAIFAAALAHDDGIGMQVR